MKKKASLLDKLDESLSRAEPAPAPAAPASAPVRAAPAAPAVVARRRQADELVHRAVPWAVAAGIIPVTPLAAAGIAAVQIKLVRDLCLLYQVPFSEHRAKSLVAALAGAGLPAAIAHGSIGASLRLVPAVGPVLGLATLPAGAAAITLAVGKLFVAHFESNGTFLHLDSGVFRSQVNRELADTGGALKKVALDFAAELRP